MPDTQVTSVVYAGYGVWNKTNNCTNGAQGRIQDDYDKVTVTFLASNDAWGPDPAPGERKYFFISWHDPDGTIKSGVVGEDDSKGVVVPTGKPA